MRFFEKGKLIGRKEKSVYIRVGRPPIRPNYNAYDIQCKFTEITAELYKEYGEVKAVAERLFQRIFMRKGLLWKNTTGRRIRLGDGENPMMEEMNIPDSDIRICHIQNGSCN